jgi:hypothetical protein
MLTPESIRTELTSENGLVKASEDEIRAYFVKHRVLVPVQLKSNNSRMIICFLAIYGALAFIAVIGLFCINRMACDPMFTDRGLSGACRNWSGDLGKVIGTTNGALNGANSAFTQPDSF